MAHNEQGFEKQMNIIYSQAAILQNTLLCVMAVQKK
jgi:hypothetical protein